MAQKNAFLSKTELDFESLRDSIKTFLASQDRIRDYDFEGSNVAVLLDVLAWNAHLYAHYLNMIGSEMWLDTAQLRDSLFSHAKELNYVPRSKVSSRALVDASVNVGDDAPNYVTIPKYTSFTSTVTDSEGAEIKYKFITAEERVVKSDGFGNYVASNLSIYEGRLVTEVFTVNSTSKYVLQSSNADVSSISVNVQTSNVDTTNSDYDRAYTLYGVDGESKVFFVQGAYDGRYEVVFGDDNFGVAPAYGNVVKIKYRDTLGSIANGAKTFKADVEVDGYAVDSVTTVTPSYGGAEWEDGDSIKFYAPRHFAAQERAVVKTDFETAVLERFPQVAAVAVYGGEEVVPKRYGKVIVTCKPHGGETLSDALKSEVATFLSTKNVVVDPILVDAEFVYASVDVAFTYDPRVTSKTAAQLESLVNDAVVAYVDSVEGFGTTLRGSKLAAAIDAADEAIESNQVEFTLQKRWRPKTGSTQSIAFTFNNPLRDDARTSGYADHLPIVDTSSFTYRKDGVDYVAAIRDDGAGTLFAYAKQANGSLTVLENSIGTIDYDTGDATLSANVFSYDKYITISAAPRRTDLYVRANVYLLGSGVSVGAEVAR